MAGANIDANLKHIDELFNLTTSDLKFFANNLNTELVIRLGLVRRISNNLHEIMEFKNNSFPVNEALLNQTIHTFAELCMKAGDYYLEIRPSFYTPAHRESYLTQSIDFYLNALAAYELLPAHTWQNEIQIHINLIKAFGRKNELNGVMTVIEKIEEEVMPFVNPEENKLLLDKLYYHAASSVIFIMKQNPKLIDDNHPIEQRKFVTTIRNFRNKISPSSQEFIRTLDTSRLELATYLKSLDEAKSASAPTPMKLG